MAITTNDQNGDVDERTALLADPRSTSPTEQNGDQNHVESNEAEDPETGYNKKQVLVLSICSLVDPISFFCIVPFIPQMIFELGDIKESEVGFYAGLIESLFSVVQMFMMIPWGRAADRFGRKPILTASYIGLLIFSSLFGFSQTLWQMILLRCAAGVFSGSVVAVRSMVSENSTPKTQAAAFSIYAFFRNLGIFAGTLLGGFAKPADQFPKVFKGVWFFERFPYALPTICCGIIILVVLMVNVFAVEETLHISKSRSSAVEQPMSIREILQHPGVPTVLFIWAIVGLLGFTFTAVAPVFFWTPIKLGGYGLTPAQISLFIMVTGVSQAIWLLVVFPRLHKRIGTGGVLKACAIAWPICFALFPLANIILKQNLRTVFIVLAPMFIVAGSGCSMAFTAVQLAVNDIAPSHSTLGTLNGIALSLQSGVRAFAPGTFTSLYALGVDRQILAGELIWLVLIGVALIYGASLFWLPKKVQTVPR